MSSKDMSDQHEQRTLANLEQQTAECAATNDCIGRYRPTKDVITTTKTNDYQWLKEWVHFGTGDIPSPWDELTWADRRTPEWAEFPAMFSDYATTLSDGQRIVGHITSIHYHRQLAVIRTACGENFAGPLHRVSSNSFKER